MQILILALYFLFLVLQQISFANLPVKMTDKGICFSPEHSNYEKVKNYIKTFKSVEECLKAGGYIPEQTSKMKKSENIKYEGKIYRDDRIFVMNLSKGKVEINNEIFNKFILVTYRNSVELVATRADHFDTKEDAENYIKKVEHETPLISQNGKPLSIPNNVDVWQFWFNWLKTKNLNSAISGYQNLSYKYNLEGGSFVTDNYITLVISENNPTLILEDTTNQN